MRNLLLNEKTSLLRVFLFLFCFWVVINRNYLLDITSGAAKNVFKLK